MAQVLHSLIYFLHGFSLRRVCLALVPLLLTISLSLFPPIRTIFKYTNLSFHKNAQLQLNSARQRKFVAFAASKFISPYKFMHYGETSFRK